VAKDWLMPYSYFCLSWDLFIFLVIFYNAIVTPLRIAIVTNDIPVLTTFDYIFDFIFCFDTVLRFFMPYIEPDTGSAITDLSLIWHRYSKSWSFKINVIASLPVLNLFFGLESAYIKLPRMIRVLHFLPMFADYKEVSEW